MGTSFFDSYARAMVFFLFFLCRITFAQGESKADLAQWIIAQTDVRMGICLDLGCGDTSLAIELAKATRLKIRCIDPDTKTILKARGTVDGAGLYGIRVSTHVETFSPLPYPDHCANLIVFGDGMIDGLRGRDLKEIFRVLNPNGAALLGGAKADQAQLEAALQAAGITRFKIIRKHGVWAHITKPRNAGWDEWTHRNHDSGNTYGSRDTTISGVDFRTQWVNEPADGMGAANLILAAGRQFVTCAHMPGQEATTPSIHAYDAFNGILLWERVGKKNVPFDRSLDNYHPIRPCSDVIGTDQYLYILGGANCYLLDTKTGKTIKTWPVPATAGNHKDDVWLYISLVGDTLYGVAGKSLKRAYYSTYRGESNSIFALDAQTGKTRWVKKVNALISSFAIGEGAMFYCDLGRKLHALNVKTGKERWVESGPGYLGQLKNPVSVRGKKTVAGSLTHVIQTAYFQGKLWVLHSPWGHASYSGRRLLDVFSARDGAFLFRPNLNEKKKSRNTFGWLSFSNDIVFTTSMHGSGATKPLNPKDGSVLKKLALRLSSGGGCVPGILTPNCFLWGRVPSITDLIKPNARGQLPSRSFSGFRTPCFNPMIPANGMLYVQAAGCACRFPIRANLAMMPGISQEPDQTNRLIKGSAYGWRAAEKTENEIVWESQRGNAERTGITVAKGIAPLSSSWVATLPGKITPLAAGGGLVFCGSSDHRLYALEATTGKPRWRYYANGPIVISPFLAKGLIYFGDEVGGAYCLRADSGDLVWKFNAAATHEKIVAFGEVISRRPVGSGVLVHEGTAYCVAGLFPDEGTIIYALDAQTGVPEWEKLYGLKGNTRKFVPRGPLTIGANKLIIPTKWGPPQITQRDDASHDVKGARSPYGPLVMEFGNGLLGASRGFVFVKHTKFHDLSSHLPVIDGDRIYLRFGRKKSKSGPMLRAENRSAFVAAGGRLLLNKKRTKTKSKSGEVSKSTPLLWEAWKGIRMTMGIKAGDVLYSTGLDSSGAYKIYATAVADGKERWSEKIALEPSDMAFNGDRLFVVCGSATVVCFGRRE